MGLLAALIILFGILSYSFPIMWVPLLISVYAYAILEKKKPTK